VFCKFGLNIRLHVNKSCQACSQVLPDEISRILDTDWTDYDLDGNIDCLLYFTMTQNFRIYCQTIHLTYQECELDLEDILQHLQFVCSERNIIIRSYLLYQEEKNIH
ncbi:7190_t:CDS:2, partial [Dentiscutata erythropus]